FVSFAADEVEGSGTHEVARLRIAYLPRPHDEPGGNLGKRNHHALAPGVHVNCGNQHKMVEGVLCGIKHGAPHGVWAEDTIGVSEQNPLACSLLCTQPHGVSLAQPAGWQFANMDDAQA